MRTLRRFTRSEDRKLITAWNNGMHRREIAHLLKRTDGVISQRVRRLRLDGILIASRPGRGFTTHWSPEQDQRLRELWNGQNTMHQIAIQVDRPLGSIHSRALRIGLGPKPHIYKYPSYRLDEMMVVLLREGFTESEIARVFEVTRQRINQRKHRIALRAANNGHAGQNYPAEAS